MTPREKILRDGLRLIDYGKVGTPWKSNTAKGLRRIAGETLEQADAVKDGPSEGN